MTFDAIGIAGSALTVNRKWLDAISDNIANVNTARRTNESAFQARYLQVEAAEGTGGVFVKSDLYGSTEGRLSYQPDNPLADENGMVRMPDIDMAAQMSALIIAQRAYAANAAVVDRARESYTNALQIGRG
ncbi:flagellar basal body rod protein FlgC [Pseudolysinimonas sp.]